MRIGFCHRREIMEVLEELNEESMARVEAILLRMCRV